ncbi:protein C2-DOMAIN ABA-RELATED 9-like [Vigna umbellata]|uniref:protein C2-DOMAIN ABA-RELATED 9-like n=1 Tax=Vigna umbellata TaxID=87088 RepID=UPI001F5FA62B|nr:protein C2-DOMAIN ABA-RELATED 9-like [Vigna umbellata]
MVQNLDGYGGEGSRPWCLEGDGVVFDGALRDIRPTLEKVMQKLKTSVKKNNCNPEWNEERTLSIKDVTTPIRLSVYDKDTFSGDDKMGDADIDLIPYVQSVRMGWTNLPNGTVVRIIQPDETNCLAKESNCVWQNENIVQEMVLKLRNVESGEIVVQIEWVDVIGCKGLSHLDL